jgi:hypothetical protein
LRDTSSFFFTKPSFFFYVVPCQGDLGKDNRQRLLEEGPTVIPLEGAGQRPHNGLEHWEGARELTLLPFWSILSSPMVSGLTLVKMT